jgi:hypothetical protein
MAQEKDSKPAAKRRGRPFKDSSRRRSKGGTFYAPQAAKKTKRQRQAERKTKKAAYARATRAALNNRGASRREIVKQAHVILQGIITRGFVPAKHLIDLHLNPATQAAMPKGTSSPAYLNKALILYDWCKAHLHARMGREKAHRAIGELHHLHHNTVRRLVLNFTRNNFKIAIHYTGLHAKTSSYIADDKSDLVTKARRYVRFMVSASRKRAAARATKKALSDAKKAAEVRADS